jgi:hypothetical protein
MRRSSFLNGFISLSLWIGVLVFFYAPAAVAQEEREVPIRGSKQLCGES